MRRLEHCNIVKLKYFFYSSGEKVRVSPLFSLIRFVLTASHISICRQRIVRF